VQDAPDEELEEEPRLKYKRLGSSVPELLGKDAASCLCVSDKILVLGTHDGTLHILDFDGNEVRGPASQAQRINLCNVRCKGVSQLLGGTGAHHWLVSSTRLARR